MFRPIPLPYCDPSFFPLPVPSFGPLTAGPLLCFLDATVRDLSPCFWLFFSWYNRCFGRGFACPPALFFSCWPTLHATSAFFFFPISPSTSGAYPTVAGPIAVAFSCSPPPRLPFLRLRRCVYIFPPVLPVALRTHVFFVLYPQVSGPFWRSILPLRHEQPNLFCSLHLLFYRPLSLFIWPFYLQFFPLPTTFNRSHVHVAHLGL